MRVLRARSVLARCGRSRHVRSAIAIPLAIAVALGASLVWATPAVALVTHRLIARFDGGEAPGGPFTGSLRAAAVDDSAGASSGDVYVGEEHEVEEEDEEEGYVTVIDKFSAAGAYAGVQIDGAETPQGSFALFTRTTHRSSGIAVDPSTGVDAGDVYVADIEHGVVDKFTETGQFVCQITGAATPSIAECDPLGSETPQGSMEPRGLAVSASGEVYVADSAHDVIDEFGPGGEYVGQIADAHLVDPGAIALDASGKLYVDDAPTYVEGTSVVEFDAAGAFIAEVDGNGPRALTVDATDDHVLVAENAPGHGQVAELDDEGHRLDTFAHAELAIAVDNDSGEVYSGSPEGTALVEIYGPSIVVPDVSTGVATAVGEARATLNGVVDPDTVDGGGPIVECVFEYGTTTSYGQTAPCAPSTPYTGTTDVNATIAIAPDTTYHFRVRAANADVDGGASEGEDETFETPGAPAIGGELATATTRAATLHATIDPSGFDTACEVQYVETALFAGSGYADADTAACAPADLGAGFAEENASASLSGLRVGTSYHYRFLATSASASAPSVGADQTFTTFGISSFSVALEDGEAHSYTQAGGHPYELVTSIALNTSSDATGEDATDANPKDLIEELPAGIVADVDATPRCTAAELATFQCSGSAQVGVLTVHEDTEHGLEQTVLPLYNLVPPTGVPFELGGRSLTIDSYFITANVRTGGDYGITAEIHDAPSTTGISGATLELWGVPAASGHDAQRECPTAGGGVEEGPCSAGTPEVPFLTDPTSCAGTPSATLRVDSWQEPGDYVSARSTLPGFTGCERLGFTPALSLQPDTSAADSPSGLSLTLQLPQDEAPEGLASASLQQAVVTLPAGVSVSPAAAAGLQACSQAEIGLEDAAPPSCPEASKIGLVQIHTPLLPDPLTGSIYVAEQGQNPFGSLFAVYVTAQADGALVKLAGNVELDPGTGQVTIVFAEAPELPLSEIALQLFGGAHGVLATPDSCGALTSTVALSPWSGAAPVTLSAPFQVSSGCVSGFSPAFAAGTVSPQAGRYTPLVLAFSRSNVEQGLAGFSLSLPPGLLAKFAGVSLCPDAGSGACPEASLVGTVQVSAGPGPQPLFLEGRVYLTGPYNGGPYGLAVVVPALAGPFDLGEVVVRQSLRVDPRTAQVTDVSDPLPTILDGIPLRLRSVEVDINRPGFMLDPTDCDAQKLAGELTATNGQTAPVSSRFQVGGCGERPFKPHVSASTAGRTSKADGASLTAKLSFPVAAAGTDEASADEDLAAVKIDLPRQLPAQLRTLQQACVAAVFEANPTRCPAHSIVGRARVGTPLLAQPLEGPAYFVSHGGEQFPSLTLLLRGDGVTIELVGATLIRDGVTSATFRALPDVPLRTFELTLAQGRFAALAAEPPASANGSLCGQRLVMPTALVAQSGAEIHEQTPIVVTGCRRPSRRGRRFIAGLLPAPRRGPLATRRHKLARQPVSSR
jgi:hypothetical protein